MPAPKQIVEKAHTFQEAVAIIERGNHVQGDFELTLTQMLCIAKLTGSGKS
jgi:hypothetical protein